MRNLPPLAQLRAFEAAARHLSFKVAANELAVTPTAISHQIKSLEQSCGLPLFRRRPRPMALTEAGARLYPVIRDGLDAFAAVVSAIQEDSKQHPLKITTTNAFASRWLVPRLPLWRDAYPSIPLEVIGTDSVLDLRSGECDLAIRYMETAPPDLVAHELFRDGFVAVCSPKLLPGGKPIDRLDDLGRHTLIHWYWSPLDLHPPTWRWWLESARSVDPAVPEIEEIDQLTFREELHAIEAAIAGQGIAILSDVLVAHELETGVLVKAADLTLPGLSYYLVYLSDHPRKASIDDFSSWACSVV
jgi:LysR family glycine cleavage system transcriptional activator